jgi:hypothetical protein
MIKIQESLSWAEACDASACRAKYDFKIKSDAPEEQVWRQIGLEDKIIDKAEASEIAVMYSTQDAQQNAK